MYRALKLRLYPNKTQEQTLHQKPREVNQEITETVITQSKGFK